MWNWLCRKLGERLVRYLETPVRRYTQFSVSEPDMLRRVLRPGDILLVEGNERISVAIKYLTQSTWSHAALYVGAAAGSRGERDEKNVLIEANLANGVVAVPLSKYRQHNTRICRPVGLTMRDRARLVAFAVNAIGTRYDLRNVIDLARYLLPTPPVPLHWRRRMLALGSADPTRAICSTLIAQAFQSVQYPILPCIERTDASDGVRASEILHLRHHIRQMPAGSVEENDGVGAAGDLGGDLLEMPLHGLGIAARQHQARRFGLCRTDGTKGEAVSAIGPSEQAERPIWCAGIKGTQYLIHTPRNV